MASSIFSNMKMKKIHYKRVETLILWNSDISLTSASPLKLLLPVLLSIVLICTCTSFLWAVIWEETLNTSGDDQSLCIVTYFRFLGKGWEHTIFSSHWRVQQEYENTFKPLMTLWETPKPWEEDPFTYIYTPTPTTNSLTMQEWQVSDGTIHFSNIPTFLQHCSDWIEFMKVIIIKMYCHFSFKPPKTLWVFAPKLDFSLITA